MKNIFTFAIALVLLAATVGGYAYLVNSLGANIASAATAKAGAETLSARDASARSMELLLMATADDAAALSHFMVSETDVVAPITAVEDAGKRTKVKPTISGITVIDLGLAAHEGVQVSLSASGSLAALTKFAATLEALPLASRLESSSFEATKDGWFGTFRIVFIKAKS